MKRTTNRVLTPALALLFGIGLAGCNDSQAQQRQAPPPPEVLVSLPVTRQVTDYEDFPGRTEAVNSIELRAHVTGYLEKVNFQEGTEVKQGDVLFEIDDRTYQAELARTEAVVAQAEAHVKRMEADYQRAQNILPSRGISKEEFDRIAGDRAEAIAAVRVAKANRDKAGLDVGFTKIRAPIDGRVSRRFIDPGNIVKADDTVLTVLVSQDPIYAYFDLDERTTLRMQELMRKKVVEWSPDGGMDVFLGLANEVDYPRKGTVTFADNRVDAETGTWRLRGRFPNADHVLPPGLFVRIRLPIGKPYYAVLVAEQALGTDQGQKFVYVVGDDGKVSYRKVTVGRLHNGLRVISEGLAKDEKVVVSGLQRVRQGIQVVPKLTDMPGSTQSTDKK
jgi:RND family efflux transporter MFP subunit